MITNTILQDRRHVLQLGNEMFVYAMLYAVAKRSGFEVSIDWPRGEELFGIKSRELDFTPTNRYEEKKGMVFDPEVFSQPDGTDFFGYFQSEKYFKECREDILRLFSPGEDVRVKVDRIFVEKARDARKTIVLGVRGKDYYTSFGWPVPGPTYYKEGLKIISEKDGIELSDYDLVCVTDDEKLGRRILKHIPNIDFLGESALVELFFMSRADRLIIPASSFHWWGAWLNNKPGKIVIAPSYWLNCAHKEPAVWWPRDIKCEGWVCVKPRQFMRSGRLVLWRNVSNSYIYKKMKNIAYRIKKLKAAGVRGWRYILEKIIAYILLQGRMFVSSNNYFAVTYANDRKTDGSGAQLQRIYGIYAVSRFLKCKYVHSPLARVDYLGLKSLETGDKDQSILERYNKHFNIPSDPGFPVKYEVFDIDRPALFPLLRASIKALAKKRHTLARIILPYNIIDRYPILWRQATDISPFKNAGSGKIRVAVHIRRGELLVAFSDRMLPNQYYLSVMDLIKEALEKNNLDYEFEIYTEVPKKAFKVKDISDYSLAEVKELAPEQCGLSDFDAVEGLKWFINEDPIDDLERMATADIFVMSHSSFSMLAAVLNPRGIVIYHPFWHAQMPEWITADNSGNFDKKLFLRRLRSMEDMSKDDCISG